MTSSDTSEIAPRRGFLKIREVTDIPPLLLLAVNVVPLIGVIWLGWDVRGLMLLYWSENLIIGVMTIVKMLAAAPIAGLFSSAFFAVHYGGFCAIHGLFILAMTGGDFESVMNGGESSWPFFLIFFEILFVVVKAVIDVAPPIWFLAFGALLISHATSLILNFFVRGERNEASGANLMGSPYVRVIILHITILAGGFAVLAFGSPTAMLVLLVILKTAVDLVFHLREHRSKKLSKDESPSVVVPTAMVALMAMVLAGCAGENLSRSAGRENDCLVVSPDASAPSGGAVDAYASRQDVRAALSNPSMRADCRGTPASQLVQRWGFPAVRLLPSPAADERDILDDGVDILVTRRPDVIEYARRDTMATVRPLAWDRAYALVAREPFESDIEGRSMIALEAVQADARRADAVGWLTMASDCPVLSPPADSVSAREVANRVVFESDDPVAADIAARLVSLLRRSGVGRRQASAAGLPADEFSRRLADGLDAFFVLALPTSASDPCQAWSNQFAAASWIEPDALRVLLETRDHVVVRRKDLGILIDASGLPHVVAYPPTTS